MLSKLTLLVTTSSEISKGINVDGTIGILTIFAVISFISPIVVACINNKNQAKEREKEREYETQKRNQDREDEIKKREQQILAEIEKQKMENYYKLQMHKYDSYYKNQTLVFEQVLEKVGDLLGDTENKGKYSIAMACINKAFAYSDDKLTCKLDTLRQFVGIYGGLTKGDIGTNDVFEQLKEVAEQINIILRKNADIE